MEGSLSLAPETARTPYTDASGELGRGASLGDLVRQGAWSGIAEEQGVNWRRLWFVGEALRQWVGRIRGKLILVRSGKATAVAHSNYGLGSPRQLAQPPRSFKELELS